MRYLLTDQMCARNNVRQNYRHYHGDYIFMVLYNTIASKKGYIQFTGITAETLKSQRTTIKPTNNNPALNDEEDTSYMHHEQNKG